MGFSVSDWGCVALRLAVLCFSFYTFFKGGHFSCAPHEVPSYIGLPSYAILHMLPTNVLLDMLSKKCDFTCLL